jgi:hypothetical protein
MECPTCRFPVPVEWSMCRRCGAPLPAGPVAARIKIPSTLPLRRSAAGATMTLAVRPEDRLARPAPLLARPAGASAGPAPAPSALIRTRDRPHPLIAPPISPRARAGLVTRSPWRHVVVLVIVAVALTASVIAVWPVVFRANPSSSASNGTGRARASGLLRTVVGGGRTLYAAHDSFSGISPATLSAHSYGVPIVASTTVARIGEVSMDASGRAELTLATPADATDCVFARDEPTPSIAASVTQTATVHTGECRASAAPARGWSRA